MSASNRPNKADPPASKSTESKPWYISGTRFTPINRPLPKAQGNAAERGPSGTTPSQAAVPIESLLIPTTHTQRENSQNAPKSTEPKQLPTNTTRGRHNWMSTVVRTPPLQERSARSGSPNPISTPPGREVEVSSVPIGFAPKPQSKPTGSTSTKSDRGTAMSITPPPSGARTTVVHQQEMPPSQAERPRKRLPSSSSPSQADQTRSQSRHATPMPNHARKQMKRARTSSPSPPSPRPTVPAPSQVAEASATPEGTWIDIKKDGAFSKQARRSLAQEIQEAKASEVQAILDSNPAQMPTRTIAYNGWQFKGERIHRGFFGLTYLRRIEDPLDAGRVWTRFQDGSQSKEDERRNLQKAIFAGQPKAYEKLCEKFIMRGTRFYSPFTVTYMGKDYRYFKSPNHKVELYAVSESKKTTFSLNYHEYNPST